MSKKPSPRKPLAANPKLRNLTVINKTATAPAFPKALKKTLTEILQVPTAPFHEQWLVEHILLRISKLKGVTTRFDGVGNLFVRYRPSKGAKPAFALQAHLDHPGYVVEEALEGGLYRVQEYGGVPENVIGATLRFFSSAKDKGRVAKIVRRERKDDRAFAFVRATKPLAVGSIGMWDLPAFELSGVWADGRGFDDNLGIGLLIYVLEGAVKRKSKTAFDLLFTRAEETGYTGLLEALRDGRPSLPQKILTVEMPRAWGDLVAGDGVMLRAGDRNMNFDAPLLLYFEAQAKVLATKYPWFAHQRRLGLIGGTEVTLFQLHGFQAGCLCVPVVNGHNIDFSNNGRPTSERVHQRDLLSLVQMLEHLISAPWEVEKNSVRLKETLFKRSISWRKDLLKRPMPKL